VAGDDGQTIQVFAADQGGRLFVLPFGSAGGSAWQQTGLVVPGPFQVVALGGRRVQVFAHTATSRLWHETVDLY
jgi:hypothetical protein